MCTETLYKCSMAGAASTAGGGASGVSFGESAPEASLGSWPKADTHDVASCLVLIIT